MARSTRLLWCALAAAVSSLTGCLSFEAYGNPCVAELEPLAEGWVPDLVWRNPVHGQELHQYRWTSSRGVIVAIGTRGSSDQGLTLDGFISNTSAELLTITVDTHGDGDLCMVVNPWYSDEARVHGGDSFTLEAHRWRAFNVGGVRWLDEPEVGSRFALDLRIQGGDVCPLAFAVNHLEER